MEKHTILFIAKLHFVHEMRLFKLLHGNTGALLLCFVNIMYTTQNLDVVATETQYKHNNCMFFHILCKYTHTQRK